MAQIQNKFSRKKLLRIGLGAFFCLALSGAPTQKAYADGAVWDAVTETETAISAGIDQVEWAWTQVQDQIKEGQTAWAATINGIGQSLQARIATMTADVANTNNRTNVQAATGEAIAVKYGKPTSYNACAFAQAAAAGAETNKTNHAIAQAVANGGANRPATPAAVAADIKATEASGLGHCAPQGNVGVHQGAAASTDTESSVDRALGCVDPFPGWEGADETPSAIFDYYQFPIAIGFKPPTNGVYQTIPAPQQALDMPFIAALSFCNRINTRLPPAPQAITGHVTVDALAIDAYRDMKAKASAAYSTCIYDVFERTQYTNNAQMDPRFVAGNTTQEAQCAADVTKGLLDGDPQYQYYDSNGNKAGSGSCSSLGRSELQARFDLAWRDLAKSYQGIYLLGLTPDAQHADLTSAGLEKTILANDIAGERAALTSAIEAASTAQQVYSSALSQSVTKP
jgi:hypothetical protein